MPALVESKSIRNIQNYGNRRSVLYKLSRLGVKVPDDPDLILELLLSLAEKVNAPKRKPELAGYRIWNESRTKSALCDLNNPKHLSIAKDRNLFIQKLIVEDSI